MIFAWFCDRCGHYFEATAVELLCPGCLYANSPQRVILGIRPHSMPRAVGFGRRTPLIKKPGAVVA
jgi:hypothetical protein